MMRRWQVCVGPAALAIALTSWAAPAPQASGGAKSKAPDSSQVERITLPSYLGEIPKGPNVEVYEKDCLVCHTSRYVTGQPPFSRSTWEKEVKKMIDAYGANIPEADQGKIVDYLVAVRGASEKK